MKVRLVDDRKDAVKITEEPHYFFFIKYFLAKVRYTLPMLYTFSKGILHKCDIYKLDMFVAELHSKVFFFSGKLA